MLGFQMVRGEVRWGDTSWGDTVGTWLWDRSRGQSETMWMTRHTSSLPNVLIAAATWRWACSSQRGAPCHETLTSRSSLAILDCSIQNNQTPVQVSFPRTIDAYVIHVHAFTAHDVIPRGRINYALTYDILTYLNKILGILGVLLHVLRPHYERSKGIYF